MTPGHVNWAAVGVAAVSMFMLGGLWYSPVLFGPRWQRAAGVSDADLKRRSPARVFGLSLICTIAMAANLAYFLATPDTTASFGALAGLLAGFGWATLSVTIVALFERRPFAYVVINGGYLTLAFIVMGFVIGVWR